MIMCLLTLTYLLTLVGRSENENLNKPCISDWDLGV